MRSPSSANPSARLCPHAGTWDGLLPTGPSTPSGLFSGSCASAGGGGPSTPGTPGLRVGEEAAQSCWGRARSTQAPGARPGAALPSRGARPTPRSPPAGGPSSREPQVCECALSPALVVNEAGAGRSVVRPPGQVGEDSREVGVRGARRRLLQVSPPLRGDGLTPPSQPLLCPPCRPGPGYQQHGGKGVPCGRGPPSALRGSGSWVFASRVQTHTCSPRDRGRARGPRSRLRPSLSIRGSPGTGARVPVPTWPAAGCQQVPMQPPCPPGGGGGGTPRGHLHGTPDGAAGGAACPRRSEQCPASCNFVTSRSVRDGPRAGRAAAAVTPPAAPHRARFSKPLRPAHP